MRIKLFLFCLLAVSCNRHMAVSVKESAPSPEVYNFHDVVQHISNTSYRVTDIDYDESVSIAYMKPIYGESEVIRNHYAKLAQTVDELNLVNYQCDTIQIYDSWSEWSVGDVYNSPYSNYHIDFKCRKGLYELVDYKLEPKHFDEEYVNEKTRALYEPAAPGRFSSDFFNWSLIPIDIKKFLVSAVLKEFQFLGSTLEPLTVSHSSKV